MHMLFKYYKKNKLARKPVVSELYEVLNMDIPVICISIGKCYKV